MAWSLQISEDLLLVTEKVNITAKQADSTLAQNRPIPKIKLPKSKNTEQNSTEPKEVVSVNVNTLHEADKELLLQRLIDKEKEVFLLSAELRGVVAC